MPIMDVPGYESLQNTLQRAYDQAARTKGAERHANALPFHEQPMQTIAAKHGVGFLLGQADKKSVEAHGMLERGETNKAIHELLGAINYIAGAIIFTEAQEAKKAAAPKQAAQGCGDPECPACSSDSDAEAEAKAIMTGFANVLQNILGPNVEVRALKIG